jgi:ABC-type amino acid transport substrate-binding protein
VVRVGTKEAPPFSIKAEDGSWSGISIDLLDKLVSELGYQTRYEERGLDELLAGVEGAELDVAAAALTVTSERERRLDFTHPYFTSGLGIAAPREEGSALSEITERVFSSKFLLAVATLAGILALAGFLLWLFERKRNAAQFGGSTAKGLGSAFWWSAVTMTTVGYGDKAPVTLGGRLVGLVWMFASIILIAGFTGAIASALTVSELSGSIHGPEDLPGLKIGTVPESTSAQWLGRHGHRRAYFASPDEALAALAAGKIDAVVYDHPLLAWRVGNDPVLTEKIIVLPRTFERQDYAFAIPPRADRREEMNRIIVRILGEDWWDDLVKRYLGD